MSGEKLPPAELLGAVVKRLTAYRGYTSPELFARSFAPKASPISARDLRRIEDGEANIDEMKLTVLDGMLDLPFGALWLVYGCDAEALRMLDFDGDEKTQRFMVGMVEQAINPPRGRRATDRKRATG